MLKKLREAIGNDKVLTIAGAAGNWVLDVGFDLSSIIEIVDWINVMTYDYFGPWESTWGAYTGPNSPLYNAAPKGFSGKLNVDFTIKYYSCYTKHPSKLVMGVGFYGRFWKRVSKTPIDGKDGLWRMASADSSGKFEGGVKTFEEIQTVENFEFFYHEGTKTPYMYSASEDTFMSFDNKDSMELKVKYALDKVNYFIFVHSNQDN